MGKEKQEQTKSKANPSLPVREGKRKAKVF